VVTSIVTTKVLQCGMCNGINVHVLTFMLAMNTAVWVCTTICHEQLNCSKIVNYLLVVLVLDYPGGLAQLVAMLVKSTKLLYAGPG